MGHKHRWVEVWNNGRAGLALAVTKRIYQCSVKRCQEMGYSC